MPCGVSFGHSRRRLPLSAHARATLKPPTDAPDAEELDGLDDKHQKWNLQVHVSKFDVIRQLLCSMMGRETECIDLTSKVMPNMK